MLGASSFTYAEAGLGDWIGAYWRVFAAIGGVPHLPGDNTKTAVIKACLYEPTA